MVNEHSSSGDQGRCSRQKHYAVDRHMVHMLQWALPGVVLRQANYEMILVCPECDCV